MTGDLQQRGPQPVPYSCPYCGESNETIIDVGDGESQDYIEDCAVCCQPIHLVMAYDPFEGRIDLDARREDD